MFNFLFKVYLLPPLSGRKRRIVELIDLSHAFVQARSNGSNMLDPISSNMFFPFEHDILTSCVHSKIFFRLQISVHLSSAQKDPTCWIQYYSTAFARKSARGAHLKVGIRGEALIRGGGAHLKISVFGGGWGGGGGAHLNFLSNGENLYLVMKQTNKQNVR